MAFTIESNGVYRSGDLVMIPGAVERIIAHLYYQLESDGRLEILFHEAAKPTLRWFLEQYMSPERSTLLCYRTCPDGEYEGHRPLGMTWVNKAWKIGENFRKVEVGMGFVRGVPVDDTVELGRMTLSWCFGNLPVDAVVGATPSPNRAAVIYGQRLGFVQAGPVEGWTCWKGKLCSVVMQSMTRARWLAINSSQVEAA